MRLRQCTGLGEMLIIDLSGYVPPNVPEKILSAGFGEYPVKPVKIETLEKLLEKCRTLG